MTKPLALSDAQMNMLYRLSTPLVPADRTAFLTDVATQLAQTPEDLRGDGLVARIAIECQRRYWSPPIQPNGKYR
jgi:hypothetical protein